VVRDYDEAIDWYRDRLGLTLLEDAPREGGKRWVVMGGAGGAALLLARAANERQNARIGDQTGGRVFLFLHTDDFRRDHRRMQEAGVEFVEMPREEPYGTVAVFTDLYGNRWDLVQPR
jgi:catechol 2,3-dioxygenase-like lactoylglutathione lyase family enzyme